MEWLKIEKLHKSYYDSEKFSLADIDLSINQGEILSLVGESGSGKTTLLRLIAGFEKPDQGSISIKGRTVSDENTFIKPEARKVGMVFQDFALFPHLSVQENIAFGLRKIPGQEKASITKKLLSQVELTRFKDRYPHQLSGGQQQRVALARAIAPNPNLILLDEPFSNLDDLSKEILRNEVRGIIKMNEITAIFVTHDTKDAMAVSDRIAIMKKGRIHQIDEPEIIYRNPVNAYIAEFFGKANFMKAKVRKEGYETSFGTIPDSRSVNFSGTVQLMVRPEAISICDERNKLASGKVLNSIFLGSKSYFTIQVKDQVLIMHVHERDEYSKNDIVHFTIQPSQVVVLNSN